MAQYDGSIRINTKISTETSEKSLVMLSQTIMKTAKEISSLRSKMEALKGQKFETDDYKKLQSDLGVAEKKLSELVAKQDEWEKLGVTSGGAWDALNEEIAKASDNVDAIKEKMYQLKEAGKAFNMGENTQEYANLEQQLQSEEEALRKAQELKAVAEKTGDPYARLSEALNGLASSMSKVLHPIEAIKASFASAAETLKAKAAGMTATIINGIVHPFQTMKTIASGVISGVSKLLSGMASVAKRAGSAIKSIASYTLRIGKNSKKASSGISKMGMGFKNLLKYGLGIRSLYALVSKFRTAVKEGFSNMYKDTNMLEFKRTVDNLRASLLTFKNAFAAAFRPIAEIVIPNIQKLTDCITVLLDKLGQFFASITGQKTYTRAIKQTADAFNDEKDAIKETKEELEGYLSPLDEINKYATSKNDADKDKEIEEVKAPMFEEVPVSEKFKDIAQWFKDMWANADFTELGSMIGQKLKNALDNIPWEGIKETARKIGSSIATLINGFVEVAGLGFSIGKTLAEAINTGFEYLNSFVHNLHWESIGKFIAETINGFFTNIDWDLVYDTFITGAKGLGDAINSLVDYLDWEAVSDSISNFFNTFVDTIYTFVTTVDWKELGQKVGKAISDAWTGIDWKKAGETLGEVFKAFFDFVGQAIEAVDWWAVGESVKDFLVGIDWAGVAESLFEAIGAALGALAAFLGGLISDGVEAAKEYFQEKIEEAGGNVVEGIFNGIIEAVKNIGSWINEHIFQPFIEGFKKAFGIHSPSTVMAEMGNFLMEGLFNGISALVDKVVAIFTAIKDKIAEVWEAVKKKASEIWDAIKKKISDIWNGIKTAVSAAINNVKTTISSAWNTIKSTTTSVWNGIKSIFNGFVQFLSGVFTGNWRKAWDGIVSIFEGVKDNIKSVINGILTLVETLANGVINGINFVIGALNNLHFDIPDWVPLLGGKTFGFSIPELPNVSIPRLATGAVIPANREFLAVLGDQKHGTNVEAPLDTIKQAQRESLLEILSELGLTGSRVNSNPQTIIIKQYLDGKQVAESVVKEGKVQQMSTGNNMFLLGTK